MLNLGYYFTNPALLDQAFTHKSYTFEQKMGDAASNERLEFLGDAVLELCVSDLLYTLHPRLSEGKLTERRASLVCESSLACIARGLSLGQHLRMGNGEESSGGREKDSLLSDALEAILGAIYLDGGYTAARTFVTTHFTEQAKQPAQRRDHKTTLQEILQKQSGKTAEYHLLSQEGPPHARVFITAVTHNGITLGTGEGRSKKESEQSAAREGLRRLKD